MTEQQQEARAAFEFKEAAMIGGVAYALGVAIAVLGVIAAVVALVNLGVVGALATLAVTLFGGTVLMALGAIVRLLTHIARR